VVRLLRARARPQRVLLLRWIQPPTGRLVLRDFTLPNSLRHEVLDPMRSYRLSYAELGLELDVIWTALSSG
jgi:hypothetical protein